MDRIAPYLTDASNDAISTDSKRGAELVATAEVENGVGREAAPVPATRVQAYVAIPYREEMLGAVRGAVCELASVLGVATGSSPSSRALAWRTGRQSRHRRRRSARG